ncbi:MAG: hypothetical protein KAI33_10085, partial [Elusimicrobiales bacterium]|nr:hypothetical protein [Elusimicrobiales bacterium]
MYQYIVSDFQTEGTIYLEENPFASDDMPAPRTPPKIKPHIPLPHQNILPSSIKTLASTNTLNT